MTRSRAGTLLKGLGALAALAVATVGVPLALETVAGNPIPDALPSWSQIGTSLTSGDDGTLLLGLLKYAAWAGWALFVLSVVVDVTTRLRGLPTPRLGPQQQLATRLVGAVLALAVSVSTALPAAAFPPPTTTASQSVGASGTGNRGAAANPEAGAAANEQQSFEEYRVRRGDCLWDIAWNELGEPERWPEIYQASRTVRQPDGRRLTDPDLIVTGWVLHIPAPGDGHSAGAARGTPMSESDSTPESFTTPDPTKVVTPLSGRGRSEPPKLQPTPSRTALRPVATALNTSGPATRASAMERRWLEASLPPATPGAPRRDWRARISETSR